MQTIEQSMGERLRQARKTAGFKTARAFTEYYHLPPSTYSQYETGRRRCHIDVLIRFCTLLNISADWLLFGYATPQEWAASPSQMISSVLSSPKRPSPSSPMTSATYADKRRGSQKECLHV